jgi:hypothetical protein
VPGAREGDADAGRRAYPCRTTILRTGRLLAPSIPVISATLPRPAAAPGMAHAVDDVADPATCRSPRPCLVPSRLAGPAACSALLAIGAEPASLHLVSSRRQRVFLGRASAKEICENSSTWRRAIVTWPDCALLASWRDHLGTMEASAPQMMQSANATTRYGHERWDLRRLGYNFSPREIEQPGSPV